jgi:hypothetical protein
MTDTENDIQMNADELFREDVFTDNAVGTLRRLTPVTADGDVDETRVARYLGSSHYRLGLISLFSDRRIGINVFATRGHNRYLRDDYTHLTLCVSADYLYGY